MQDVVPMGPALGRNSGRSIVPRLLSFLPRGNTLDDRAWHRRHRLLQRVLLLHGPLLVVVGLTLKHSGVQVAQSLVAPAICLALGHFVTHRRWASFLVTGGLVFCSIALVLLTAGSIEAHFHFFIIIGFIALYQDWVPFLWNVAFTTISHGMGTIWLGGQIFNHPAAQAHPWLWSFVHGVAVLFACVGVVIFWRITEEEQGEKEALGRQLITADAEIGRRKFTSEMLVNLARRNQSMLYRQLDIINDLENKERDPDALADLFKLDHLATRVRRNAESLLVLAGQQAPRTWTDPVPLRDVVRAAIAETEDLDRVVFAVDDRIAVSGTAIADLTHLLAELTENAVRFSPPDTAVTIRVRPNRRDDGGHLLTVEDWGVGMPADDLAEANELLAHPRDIDLAVAQRLGFHVVARLAARHEISVSLTSTPGSGITAVVILPAALFTPTVPPGPIAPLPGVAAFDRMRAARPDPGDDVTVWRADGPARTSAEPGGDARTPPVSPQAGPTGPDGSWRGWWSPETAIPADAVGGFGASTPETTANGHGTNGHGANGHATNGHGTNGHGRNGHGVTGHATNGHGRNGHASNGHGVNGHGTNGHDTNGHGVEELAGNDVGGSGTVDGPGAPRGEAAPESGRSPVGPVTTPVNLPVVAPRSRPGGADGEVVDPGAERAPVVPAARQGSTAAAADHRAADVRPTPAPVAALPVPRSADVPPSVPGRGPRTAPHRGLRRRVPQSHLAPELRQPATGLADTASPLSADAAASALSRYQASRLAAQAVVGDPAASEKEHGGERE